MSISPRSVLNYCSILAQLALPPQCFLCGAHCGDEGLCPDCRGDLPRLPASVCQMCALPAPGATLCGRCLQIRPNFDHVIAACSYAFPADAMVQALKYRSELAVASILAHELAAAVCSEPGPDLVIAMPLSVERLRERGFNQALEIARLLCARTGFALAVDACRRVLDTTPQTSLPWSQRAKNVRRAFVCDADLQGRSVAVVDDVLTTGATLSELAATLKKRGAVSVSAWVFARTLPHG